MRRRHREGAPQSATRAELKQLAWATALVYPFIGLVAYGARELVGHRAAFWLGIGMAVLATVALWLSAALGALISWWVDRLER
jgi:hypothetical protein